jgi:putative FmdB family regulatory protein
MPTYEFRCPQGHEFEKFYRSIGTAEAAAVCPECGQPAERVMSATGFAFKGSGFYLTDYGKNAHRDKGTPPVKDGAASEGAPKGDSGAAKGDSGAAKGDSGAAAATSGTGNSGGESKKAEPKAAESKPAPAPPKKSTGE